MQELYSISSNTCRLCLSESEFQVPIFGDTSQKMGIHFKIQSCFPMIKVTQHDGLPDNICYKCVFSLEQTYEFWTKCCSTEAILSNRQVNINCHHNLEEINKRSHQPREATLFPHTSDDAEWDTWFIWDATYKVSQSEKKSPENISFTVHDAKSQQSVIFENTNNTRVIKQNEEFLKNDYLFDDVPWIDQDNDFVKFTDSNKSAPQINANNFSSSFWKQNSSYTKEQPHILKNTQYSSRLNNQTFSNLKMSGDPDLIEISQDKKSTSHFFNQNTNKNSYLSNKEIVQKGNQSLLTTINKYDDIFTNATHLLQRFRANNSLNY